MDFDFTPEQNAFKTAAETFARELVEPRAERIDQTGEFPVDVMREAANRGLFGVTISPRHGGAGRDYLSYTLAIEAIAHASASVAVSLVVTNSLVGADARGFRIVGSRRRH